MLKKHKGLTIYFIIIIIALLLIMFIIPDSFFTKKYEGVKIPSSDTEKKEFTDFETQKQHLLKNNYNYEYSLLDSMGTESYYFQCSGQINDTLESGSCTSPEKISYTETTKKEVFSKIENQYLNPQKIFELIEGITPEEFKESTIREFVYQSKIEDLDTEITITTDLDEITQICLSNAYMTYILKYSNVTY